MRVLARSRISAAVYCSTRLLGVKPTLVPFNGAGPAMTALIGGQVDYMCDGGINHSYHTCAAGRSRHMRSDRSSAVAASRTCQPQRKRGCRSSKYRDGSPCLLLRGRRNRSSTNSPTRSTRRSMTIGRTQAAARARHRNSGPGEPRSATARRACEGRDRALDADHQGGGGQVGMSRRVVRLFGDADEILFRRVSASWK